MAVPTVGVTPKRWTREEYYQLAEHGFFRDQRVERIEGEIHVMSPQSYPHYFSTDGITDMLKLAFGDGYWVRQQAPLAIGGWSDPEPDVSVVRGTRFDYSDHPTTAILVVEVARSSLDYDTRTKPPIYAKASIPDYWVLDLINRQLIVHRDPVEDKSHPLGYRYGRVRSLGKDESIAPLDKPEQVIAVAKMLPPEK